MTTEPNADVKRVARAIYHAAHPKSGEWHWLDSAKQKRFVRQARAAIAAMPDREVTVQEAARILADDVGFIMDLGMWLDKNGGKRWGQVWASNMVKLGLRALSGDKP